MKELDENEEILRNEIHCIELNNNIFERSDKDIRSKSPEHQERAFNIDTHMQKVRQQRKDLKRRNSKMKSPRLKNFNVPIIDLKQRTNYDSEVMLESATKQRSSTTIHTPIVTSLANEEKSTNLPI